MSKNNPFLRLVSAVIFLLSCFIIAQAQQDQNGSLAITPASIDAKVTRGASHTQNFTITNNTGERLKFKCSVNDMWYDENNKRVTARPGTMPRSASLWVQFSPSEVIVKPYSSSTVKALITIPKEVSGSYYTVPTFEGTPVGKPDAETTAGIIKINTATASIGIRFLALMMLTTSQNAEYNVEIMGAKISPPTKSSEMEISLDLRNRGTAHAKVHGAFAVLNSSGSLVGRGNIQEKRYLPDQRDILKDKWSGELPPGNYTCVLTLSYNRVGLEPISLVYELPFIVK